MADKKELENVCREIITLLANALAGPTRTKDKVTQLYLVRRKSSFCDEFSQQEAHLRHSSEETTER